MGVSRSKDARGFALIESLVALAVLALTLVVLLQVTGSAARRLAQAEDLSFATLAAQSLLAVAGIEAPLAVGASTGVLQDGLAWRQDVTRLPDAPRALAVTITVSDRSGTQVVTLRTVRLGPP
jgi:prepilin-type N-terminal cleavage/methylation domain-containing protein